MSHKEPAGDVDDADSLDPSQLGFMCGLEIHQQLATGKLHSRHAGILYDHTIETIPDAWPRVSRRLRAAEGEGGKVDVAARFEARRNRSFVYVKSPNAGLIELDEAPPLRHDSEAVEIALTVSALMDMNPVALLQAMRKTVVDGSNTSGFQRTTLVATGGAVQTERGGVELSLLCLEEDSARKLAAKEGKNGEQVIYTLDRLGVPLIEIATEPVIQDPEHAQECALALGQVLRDTRRVRRGLGSIRQDLNVSIACGDRVEIKGCQDLDWIPRIIRLEMARQLHFYRLANELRQSLSLRPLLPDRRSDDATREAELAEIVAVRFPVELVDLTPHFSDCESKMVAGGLARGDVVLGVRLSGMAGRLGSKQVDAQGAQLPRLGRELAAAAKLAGVRGIFHSDELPAYGITDSEVLESTRALGCSETDAFALCCAPAWQAELALESVVMRARMAFHRLRREVRNVVIKKGEPEDGTTTAMRPLPGGARMYPETDVPVFAISQEKWDSITSNLPPTTEQRRSTLNERDISETQIDALLSRELDEEFLAGVLGTLSVGLEPLPDKAWASLLLDPVRSDVAEAAGAPNSEAVPLALLGICLAARESSQITRDGLVPLASEMLTSGRWNASFESVDSLQSALSEMAEKLGVVPADSSDVEAVVERILAERAEFVSERGMGALGPLMGVVIAELGSSADGKQVSAILRERLEKLS